MHECQKRSSSQSGITSAFNPMRVGVAASSRSARHAARCVAPSTSSNGLQSRLVQGKMTVCTKCAFAASTAKGGGGGGGGGIDGVTKSAAGGGGGAAMTDSQTAESASGSWHGWRRAHMACVKNGSEPVVPTKMQRTLPAGTTRRLASVPAQCVVMGTLCFLGV